MIISEEIAKIDWCKFDSAYGNAAEEIPDYVPTEGSRGYTPKVAQSLLDLFSHNKKMALQASHDLWCGLCHQHAFISSAALPAYDILFYGLQNFDDDLKVEILDIFMGFAVCLSRDTPINSWQEQLRAKLEKDKPYFQILISHSNEDISFFAKNIVAYLIKDVHNRHLI